MTKKEFIEKIVNAFEMVITLNERHFTITDEYEKGISIAEWKKRESEKHFPDAESLADRYIVGDKPIGDQADSIIIQDYTGT